jgi:hypothetical protein
MSAYVDCFACACLIRAREPSCPFCGASQHLAPAPSPKLSLGLTLGLGLAAFSCGDKEEDTASDTIAETVEADAVTYAGPDSWESTNSGPGITTTEDVGTTIDYDSSEADGTTYAGPDENTTTGDASTTSGTTSGTTSDTDSQEADAVTYAGPDETSTTGG